MPSALLLRRAFALRSGDYEVAIPNLLRSNATPASTLSDDFSRCLEVWIRGSLWQTNQERLSLISKKINVFSSNLAEPAQ